MRANPQPANTSEVQVTWSRLLPLNVSPFRNLKNSGHTRAQQAGKKFEARVLLHLSGHFHSIQASRWFQYVTKEGNARFCQPDAYDLTDGLLTIFEIKLTRTERAREQLMLLYGPVLKHFFNPRAVRYIEIVRSLSDVTPPSAKLYLDFAEFIDAPFHANSYGVLRWKL